MKKYVNGEYIDMTPEEITEMREAMLVTDPVPTIEERIARLEDELRVAKALLAQR